MSTAVAEFLLQTAIEADQKESVEIIYEHV